MQDIFGTYRGRSSFLFFKRMDSGRRLMNVNYVQQNDGYELLRKSDMARYLGLTSEWLRVNALLTLIVRRC